MWKYCLAHWRGEQGVLKTCLFNGLAVPVLVLVAIGFAGGIISVFIASNFNPGSTVDNKIFFTFIYLVWLPTALLAEIWAGVGAIRCGQRFLIDRQNSIARKFGVTVLVLTVAFFSVEGMRGAASVYRIPASPELWAAWFDGGAAQNVAPAP